MNIKSLYLLVPLFAVFTHQNKASEQNYEDQYHNLKKELTKIEEEIIFKKSNLPHLIAEKFPLEKQTTSFFSVSDEEKLVPNLLFRHTTSLPNKNRIENKINSIISFVDKQTESSTKKKKILDLLELSKELNTIRKQYKTGDPFNFLINTIEESNLNKRQNKAISDLRELFLSYSKIRNESLKNKTHEYCTNSNDDPYGMAISVLINFHVLLNMLYDSPLTGKQKPIPYFHTTISLNENAQHNYLKIWECLVDKMHFAEKSPSIFQAFKKKGSHDEELSTTYKTATIKLEHLQSCILKTIKTINTSSKIPLVTNDTLEKALGFALAQKPKSHVDLKKQANYIKSIFKSKDWITTLTMLMEQKNNSGVTLFKEIHEYLKEYIKFVENPGNMEIVKKEETPNKQQNIIPLTDSLFEHQSITLKTEKNAKISTANFNYHQFGFLFILDLCQEIDASLAPYFNEIHQLYEQKNTIVQNLKRTKAYLKNNLENELSSNNERKEEVNEKKEEVDAIQPVVAKAFLKSFITFTQKLKQARKEAQFLVSSASKSFNNDLSEEESALFHNLPINSLMEHPEIKKLYQKFLNNEPLTQSKTILFQKKNKKLFIWIPAILDYQVKGTTVTLKGAIEIFLEKEKPQTTKMFHIWFKKTDLLKETPDLSKSNYKKIVTRLSQLLPKKAQNIVEEVKNNNNLIANKDGWVLEIATDNRMILFNNNEKRTQVNWIYYQ